MNNEKYNQTCHINGDKISSVMLSACCAADVSSSSATNNNNNKNGRRVSSRTTSSMLVDPQLAGMTIVSRVESKLIGNYDNYDQNQQQVGNISKRGTNLWSEKMASSSREPTPKNNNNKPFASNPLRANSLFSNDPSLLSLYASETMEDESTAAQVVATTASNNTNTGAAAATTTYYNRPTVSSSSGSSPATAHNNDQLSQATPPNSTTTTTQRGGGEGESYTTPPRRILNQQHYNSSPTVPDSPGMELSLAKQAANMSSNNIRKNNRESFRHRYGSMDSISTMDSPTKKARGGGDGGGSSVASNSTATNRTPPQMPTKQQRGEQHAASNASIESSIQKPHLEYENASPTPHWTTTTTKDISSELFNTYQYPRLYLYDPNQIISNGENLNIISQQQQPANRCWWFHLAQRMGTTLKHVQDDHIKTLLFEQQQQQQQSRNRNGNSFRSQDSISAGESSSSIQHQGAAHNLSNFGCMDNTLDGSSQEGGCVLSDLCISQQQQQQQQQQKSGKSHRKYKSLSSNSSLSRIKKSTSTGSFPTKASKLFTPTSTPINVWSEPLASTMKVRGGTYSKDGIKIESEPSLFSVLGVDSFVVVNGKDSDNDSTNCSSWGTQNYLQRWKKACCENGMDRVPFL